MAVDKTFKLRRFPSGEIRGCESCDEICETVEHEIGFPPRKVEYCRLCYTTLISNAHQYPEQYKYVTPKMLAQAIHWLRKELKK